MQNVSDQAFLPPQQQESDPNEQYLSKTNPQDAALIIKLVDDLKFEDKREHALTELSKLRDSCPDLAPLIWYSVGTITVLLQEIVLIYPLLYRSKLSTSISNKACNVLALLQCVASHTETRSLFLSAHIPLFLYPFLNTVSKGKAFGNLRITSLGVIGALVKVDDPDVIMFLLQTEIIPLCLRIMERGSELSKTVATFIVQKILQDDNGLEYICQTRERFFAVCTVLNNMVKSQAQNPSLRLLKHIIRCYLRLSENSRARAALHGFIPMIFRETNISRIFDETCRRWVETLLINLDIAPNQALPTVAGAGIPTIASQAPAFGMRPAGAQAYDMNEIYYTQPMYHSQPQEINPSVYRIGMQGGMDMFVPQSHHLGGMDNMDIN